MAQEHPYERQHRYEASPKGKARRKQANLIAYQQRQTEKAERQAARQQEKQAWSERYKAEHPATPSTRKPKTKPPPRFLPFIPRSRAVEEDETLTPYAPQGDLDRAARNRQLVEEMRAKEAQKPDKGPSLGPTQHPWWRQIGS